MLASLISALVKHERAGRPYRAIWIKPDDDRIVQLIDQRVLPHRFVVEDVETVEQMATAIREMHVRGAPLIGAAAAYGMYLAWAEVDDNAAAALLRATRPTAVNLAWAIERQLARIRPGHEKEKTRLRARPRKRSPTRMRNMSANRLAWRGINPGSRESEKRSAG